MPALKSWLPIPASSHFSLANLPFGIITSRASRDTKRPAVAIGDHVLDLLAFTKSDGFAGLAQQSSATATTPPADTLLDAFSQPTLNTFASLGRPVHRLVREYLQQVLSATTPFPAILRDNADLRAAALLHKEDTKMHLPMRIGDYTDFYAGKNHAVAVGTLFRGPDAALSPNYVHLPVGYHGRASSIVVSGTPVHRPNGQIMLDAEGKKPSFGPSRRLDFELELGCFLCGETELGAAGLSLADGTAEQSIFGLVLLNDWSARDIQAWEYIPLGPFNSKNFATSISPWVVLADALDPFRVSKMAHDGETLPYLSEAASAASVYDVALEIDLTTAEGTTTTISRVSGQHLLWSFPQMIAHHSVGGCALRVGDLLGSGTISGPGGLDDAGSLLELSHGGARDVMLAGMDIRTFLKDGDVVTLRGVCGSPGDGLVGFGECVGRVLSAPVWGVEE